MRLSIRLAEQLIENHPERAARVLERADPREATQLVAGSSPQQVAALMQSLSPRHAADLLCRVEDAHAAGVLALLNLDAAARLLRRIPEGEQAKILGALVPRRARALRDLLRFPENTAGALMDPDVLALPEDLSARGALARVREAAAETGYNVYVVDRQQRLVGVLNLRELFLARPNSALLDLMVRAPLSVPAREPAAALIRHPGWKRVHSLPVVDEDGTYLGAVRYRTLRALEEALLAPRARDADAAQALGQLLAAGAGGLLDALSGAAGSSRGTVDGA